MIGQKARRRRGEWCRGWRLPRMCLVLFAAVLALWLLLIVRQLRGGLCDREAEGVQGAKDLALADTQPASYLLIGDVDVTWPAFELMHGARDGAAIVHLWRAAVSGSAPHVGALDQWSPGNHRHGSRANGGAHDSGMGRSSAAHQNGRGVEVALSVDRPRCDEQDAGHVVPGFDCVRVSTMCTLSAGPLTIVFGLRPLELDAWSMAEGVVPRVARERAPSNDMEGDGERVQRFLRQLLQRQHEHPHTVLVLAVESSHPAIPEQLSRHFSAVFEPPTTTADWSQPPSPRPSLQASTGGVAGATMRSVLLPGMTLPPYRPTLYAMKPPGPTWRWRGQCAQDVFVQRLLGDKRGGYYLDLATFDAESGSNTFMLDRHFGWRGVCIEATPLRWASILQKRTCTLVGAAISSPRLAHGLVRFGISRSEQSLSGIISNTTDNKEVPSDWLDYDAPTVGLVEVLRAVNAPHVIDYFSLDIEGAEDLAMEDFQWSSYRFRVLTIERPNHRLRQWLSDAGYVELDEELAWFGETMWVWQDDPEDLLQRAKDIDLLHLKEELPNLKNTCWRKP